ncbi:MAG: PHP domain-containing protein [Spirosomaceae bacterium]|nr:PHP domain-containing protein [Spirosomataceae bacterium]
MISNSEISDLFSLHANLLELNNEDERRYKTFANASYNIDRLEGNLYEMSEKQILDTPGIGRMLAAAISEVVETGTFEEFENAKEAIPLGVIDMFRVKGIGVKKIKQLWQELDIDSIEKLKAACQTNKIATLKGFGEKTQIKILASIAFIDEQKGKLRLNKGIFFANELLAVLKTEFEKIEIVGQVRQNNEVIDRVSFIVLREDGDFAEPMNPLLIKDWENSSMFRWVGNFESIETPVEIHFVSPEEYVSQKLILSADEKHLAFGEPQSLLHFLTQNRLKSEEMAYEKFGTPYIVPEMRVGRNEFEWAKSNSNENLVTYDSLKGILHNHSTYSDGKNTLREMAEYCKSLGFEYLGMADHSQTATYAQGLSPAKVLQQQEEIAELNEELGPFKILKGIESDILMNGSLDYSDEILATFDYVVASVHQTLNMDIVKATDRLLKAIENPFTTILGHPTGRLLLAREGYPLDFKTIIDACAEYKVVIEINASPYRLDIDWRWIPYCMEKGVLLSINPDAHNTAGYHDMEYGVKVARKGGLTKAFTLNSFSLVEIEQLLAKKKSRT